MTEFPDFEIRIKPALPPVPPDAGGVYPVEVYSSPSGNPDGELKLDLSAADFKSELALVRGIGVNLEGRRAFGRKLFSALFTGEISRVWENSWGQAAVSATGLRFRLRIDDPGLALLPWELLEDPHRGFLATTANVAFSRYLAVAEPPRVQAQRKLRILVVVESPAGVPVITADEIDRLTGALNGLGVGVEYDVLRNATVAQLHQALQHDYHVLHYVGHGTSGQLVLTDDAGDPYVMDDQEFAQLVQGRGTLRLVFLNACHSSQADGAGLYTGVGPSLIKAGVPAVVAMQYPAVQLTTASVFSAATYGALANGRPIDTAVNEGRKLLSAGQMLGARDWSTPVLYTGTRTGRILHLPEAENEEVEADWASVQRAARQSGAMAAFAGLSQRFQEVASRVSVLKTLTALSRLLAALRADFAPCVALVDGARGLAANIPLEQLTSAWRAVNQGGLNDLQMFITEHPATAGAQWYVDLMSSKQRINGDLADIAMVPLQNDVVAFSGRIAAAEAHVSQETARALDSFISYSDRTLGLLSVK